MAISERLRKIADLVTVGRTVADIGTDHGYVPIYLLRNEKADKAIAVDVSLDSLRKAEENAIYFHLAEPIEDKGNRKHPRFAESDKISFRYCDGLSGITPGEVETIIIAGMGGMLMKRILDEGMDVVKNSRELILSPHRDAPLIKEFILTAGFELIDELRFTDKKKEYIVFHGVKNLPDIL